MDTIKHLSKLQSQKAKSLSNITMSRKQTEILKFMTDSQYNEILIGGSAGG